MPTCLRSLVVLKAPSLLQCKLRYEVELSWGLFRRKRDVGGFFSCEAHKKRGFVSSLVSGILPFVVHNSPPSCVRELIIHVEDLEIKITTHWPAPEQYNTVLMMMIWISLSTIHEAACLHTGLGKHPLIVLRRGRVKGKPKVETGLARSLWHRI